MKFINSFIFYLLGKLNLLSSIIYTFFIKNYHPVKDEKFFQFHEIFLNILLSQ